MMTNQQKLDIIMNNNEFIENLVIPYKNDFLNCAMENCESNEANYIIWEYELEYGDKWERE